MARLNKMAESVGWLQIVISPLLFGCGIGAVVYFPSPTLPRLLIASVIVLAGLMVGVRYANKVARTRGTIDFISRISATPELDEMEGQTSPLSKEDSVE